MSNRLSLHGGPMEISFLRIGGRVLPGASVELVVVVDRRIVRVAIDWEAIKSLIDDATVDERSVRNFVRTNRQEIERAIRAHLFAHGVPLDRHLVMTLDDFYPMHPV